MEYVYAAMLLHSAGKEVNEAAVTKVLDASGVKADSARVKALIASLKDINIEEAIAKAATVAAAPVAQAASAEAKAEDKKPKEEDKKTEEEAAAGLSGLFG